MNGEAVLSAPGLEGNKLARANLKALFADEDMGPSGSDSDSSSEENYISSGFLDA
ncbi:MAG: hypothetical protein GY777_03510 [Candidatus Brocadiaceae bacterium]|nr:hypothetical protein [Candidatus Brocadiaceae bacterium]